MGGVGAVFPEDAVGFKVELVLSKIKCAKPDERDRLFIIFLSCCYIGLIFLPLIEFIKVINNLSSFRFSICVTVLAD